MSSQRLVHFLGEGGFALPESGAVVVSGPVTALQLAALPRDRLIVLARTKPEFDALQASGFDVVTSAPDGAAAVIVVLPRARAQARAQIAQALAMAPVVIVDGQKTDGVDSILRELRKRTDVSAPYSKAHGKIFAVEPGKDAFDDWAEDGQPKRNRDGFITAPGVFSADGIDPASRLLAEALPPKPGRRLADFGAGWGYLATQILAHEGVEALDLVEADDVALECARRNVTDTRARFHWADATRWRAEAPLDGIIMNPPFHEGRKGTPELGQAFIRNAAACLAPSGRLFMVANRHLPYEQVLGETFREVSEIGGDGRFKLLQGARPSRKGR